MHALSIPCLVMASINFYVGASYLFFYAKRPQIREHLPFALLCSSVGFYDIFCVGLYNSTSVYQGVFWQRLQFDAVAGISVFLIWFTGAFTGQKGNRIIRYSIFWFILLLIASLFVNPEFTLSPDNPAVKTIHFNGFPAITYYEGATGIIYQVVLISAVITYIYLFNLFIGYYGKTRYKTIRLILFSQGIYFFGVVNDSLITLQLYSFIYISEYSFFFIILAMAYTLLDRFVNLHNDFEELNANLEWKVRERTAEIEDLNEHLRALADHDPLTGAYNRRFLNEYLDIELKRAKSYLDHKARLSPMNGNDMNFGLAIIDIDHFKRINDTYGHLAGDAVLKQITDIMKKNIFSRDVLCRYGGDEFALLLTKTSNDGILHAAEKIRKEIESREFVLDEKSGIQHVTISVGLVNFDEALGRGSEEILKLADDRLLAAKSRGRNRVVYDGG